MILSNNGPTTSSPFSYLFFLLFLLLVTTVSSSTFIGFGSERCMDFSCYHLFIFQIQTDTGKSLNLSFIPDNTFSDRVDLIHSQADVTSYFLLYADVKIGAYEEAMESLLAPSQSPLPSQDKSILVTYDTSVGSYTTTDMQKYIKGVYSTCFWPGGDVLYGLGWLTDDTPFTLSVFTLSKSDHAVERLVQLPGSFLLMPDCAYNPSNSKLYFYSRNIGNTPHFMNIWEVDVLNYDYVTWNVNASLWVEPYLFHYDEMDNQMYAIVADGQLQPWLVLFNPKLTDPNQILTKLRPIPDQILSTNPISYDEAKRAFVYVSEGNIVTINTESLSRQPITGIPANTITRINFLFQ